MDQAVELLVRLEECERIRRSLVATIAGCMVHNQTWHAMFGTVMGDSAAYDRRYSQVLNLRDESGKLVYTTRPELQGAECK